MNWLAILGALGTLFGLALGCTALYRVAKAGYAKATIDTLEQDVSNWKNRVDERDSRIDHLEDQMRQKDKALERMGAQIDEQQKEISSLREMVLQRKEFNKIIEQNEAHEIAAQKRQEERRTEHARMMAADTQVLNRISEVLDAIKKVSVVINQIWYVVRGKQT